MAELSTKLSLLTNIWDILFTAPQTSGIDNLAKMNLNKFMGSALWLKKILPIQPTNEVDVE